MSVMPLIRRSAFIAFCLVIFLSIPSAARLCQAQNLVLLDVIDWQADRKVVLEQLKAKGIEMRENQRRDGWGGFFTALLFRMCPVADYEARQAGVMFAFGLERECLIYDGSGPLQASYTLFFSRKTQKPIMGMVSTKDAKLLATALMDKYGNPTAQICREKEEGKKEIKDYLLGWSHKTPDVFSIWGQPVAAWVNFQTLVEHLGGWKTIKKILKKADKDGKGRYDPLRVTTYEVFRTPGGSRPASGCPGLPAQDQGQGGRDARPALGRGPKRKVQAVDGCACRKAGRDQGPGA